MKMKCLITIFLSIFFFSFPLKSFSQVSAEKIKPAQKSYTIPILPEDPTVNMGEFYKKNLNLELKRENLARRGEIVFFSSLSYLWVYQFIVMDILFVAQFNDLSQAGKLSSTNFIYSVLTSILIALMVTRKDTQFLQVSQYHEPPTQFISEPMYYREDVHEWKFAINFMSYNF